jgi:hypothetical protein
MDMKPGKAAFHEKDDKGGPGTSVLLCRSASSSAAYFLEAALSASVSAGADCPRIEESMVATFARKACSVS